MNRWLFYKPMKNKKLPYLRQDVIIIDQRSQFYKEWSAMEPTEMFLGFTRDTENPDQIKQDEFAAGFLKQFCHQLEKSEAREEDEDLMQYWQEHR